MGNACCVYVGNNYWACWWAGFLYRDSLHCSIDFTCSLAVTWTAEVADATCKRALIYISTIRLKQDNYTAVFLTLTMRGAATLEIWTDLAVCFPVMHWPTTNFTLSTYSHLMRHWYSTYPSQISFFQQFAFSVLECLNYRFKEILSEEVANDMRDVEPLMYRDV
jgi:hypothetical protein